MPEKYVNPPRKRLTFLSGQRKRFVVRNNPLWVRKKETFSRLRKRPQNGGPFFGFRVGRAGSAHLKVRCESSRARHTYQSQLCGETTFSVPIVSTHHTYPTDPPRSRLCDICSQDTDIRDSNAVATIENKFIYRNIRRTPSAEHHL